MLNLMIKLCSFLVQNVPKRSLQEFAPLRPTKLKSQRKEVNYYSDSKIVRTLGGKGGDGCVSFLQLWCNEKAGPDGGDGGNGGHVIFQATNEVKNLNHISKSIIAKEGQSGSNRNCHGKSAPHTIVKVPVGTIVRDQKSRIVGDLDGLGVMFVAARGGSGGKGNTFFATPTEKAPKISEYGPVGEDVIYKLELRSMADIGFIGFPNAGKSTLLNAITRSKSKIASYAFTTLSPNIGVVRYADHEQLTLADLPGLVSGAYKNKGLGIQFLKHAERCSTLMFVLDVSVERPFDQYEILLFELEQFNAKITKRPQIIVANKIDMPGAKENFQLLQKKMNTEIIPVSAKMGTNLSNLLITMKNHIKK